MILEFDLVVLATQSIAS